MDEAFRVLDDGRVFVDYGPASMVITAKCGDEWLSGLACEAFPVIQAALAEIAQALPDLRRYPKDADFSHLSGLPRVMAECAVSTQEGTLTPMATVAGTVADTVADWLFVRGADFVAVNNGGDIALRLGPGRQLRMGILPDLDGGITQVVTIRAEDGIGGVCTSGLGGRSLTRGIARSVTVFSRRCAQADACATHLANCSFVQSPRIHTCRASELEPESDIADLTIVRSVETLTEEEVARGLEQVRRETEKQLALGNLLYMAADIQGSQIWVPGPLC